LHITHPLRTSATALPCERNRDVQTRTLSTSTASPLQQPSRKSTARVAVRERRQRTCSSSSSRSRVGATRSIRGRPTWTLLIDSLKRDIPDPDVDAQSDPEACCQDIGLAKTAGARWTGVEAAGHLQTINQASSRRSLLSHIGNSARTCDLCFHGTSPRGNDLRQACIPDDCMAQVRRFYTATEQRLA